MKKFLSFVATLSVFAFLNSALFAQTAPVVDYKILINGVESPTHSLAAGTHSIEIQARVTNNDLTGGGVFGGLLQSAFNLDDSADAITWDDTEGGFLGGPDGLWDSTANGAFDSHFQGTLQETDTFVLAETGAIAPGDFTSQFGDIGANVFSFIASGDFDWDGTNTTLDLSIADPFGGDILVAQVNGSAIGGGTPDEVNGASTMLMTGGGNLPPEVTNQFVDDPVGSKLWNQKTFFDPSGGSQSYQIQATDDTTDPNDLTYVIDSVEGPLDIFGNPTGPQISVGDTDAAIADGGLFSWDPTGFQQAHYFFNFTVTDGDGASSTGILRVETPEPSTIALAGLGLVGLFARRRKQA